MHRPESDIASTLDLAAIAQRVRLLLADVGIEQRLFAESIGVPYSTMRAYLAGTRPPSPEFLAGAFRVYSASPIWLLTGEGEMRGAVVPTPVPRKALDDEFVVVPRLAVDTEQESPIVREYGLGGMCVSRQWLASRELRAEELGVTTVRGASMAGVLTDGDLVLVNRADTTPRSGFIYVLQQRDELLVRYCQFLPDGLLRVSSSNSAFESYDVDLGKLPGVSIVGRVVSSTRDW